MATGRGEEDAVSPLLRTDPPRLGEIDLSGRLATSDAGVVYAGLLAGDPVVVALLSGGAETDSYARARFHDAVHDPSPGGSGSKVVAAEDDPEISPWAAVPARSWADGVTLASALLAPVTLESVEPVDRQRGPEFRPHWWRSSEPGRWRAWPLPWPASLTASGRWTYVASFAIVLAIASVALFIAVKLFEGQPPAPVPPPFPAPSVPIPSVGPSPTDGPTSPSTQSPSDPASPPASDGPPRSPGGTIDTSVV